MCIRDRGKGNFIGKGKGNISGKDKGNGNRKCVYEGTGNCMGSGKGKSIGSCDCRAKSKDKGEGKFVFKVIFHVSCVSRICLL